MYDTEVVRFYFLRIYNLAGWENYLEYWDKTNLIHSVLLLSKTDHHSTNLKLIIFFKCDIHSSAFHFLHHDKLKHGNLLTTTITFELETPRCWMAKGRNNNHAYVGFLNIDVIFALTVIFDKLSRHELPLHIWHVAFENQLWFSWENTLRLEICFMLV